MVTLVGGLHLCRAAAVLAGLSGQERRAYSQRAMAGRSSIRTGYLHLVTPGSTSSVAGQVVPAKIWDRKEKTRAFKSSFCSSFQQENLGTVVIQPSGILRVGIFTQFSDTNCRSPQVISISTSKQTHTSSQHPPPTHS